MVPEVLLALLGVPGEVIVLAPATDDAPERFRVAPDLPFLDAPERACLDRLVALGYAFRCLESFVARENDAGTLAAVGAEASTSGRGESERGRGVGAGGSLYRRALAAGVSEVLVAYEAAILRLEQDVLRGVTPALPAALESALASFAIVLPALHATLAPVIDSDGAPPDVPPRIRPDARCNPPAEKESPPERSPVSPSLSTPRILHPPNHPSDLRGAALLHHLHAASLSAGAPQLESALRALRARCERALYQQLLAWTVHGLLVDPHGEFFVRPVRGAGGDGGVWLGGDDRAVELDPRDGDFSSDVATFLPRGEDGDGDGGESEWHRGFQVSLEALPPGVELPAAEATLFVGRAVRVLTRPRGAFRGDSLLPESTSAEATAALRRLARSDGEFHRAAFEAAVEAIRRPVAARLGRLVVTDARLLAHLEALRNYHLLGRGDFFQAFFDEAANLLSAPPRPATAEADMIAPFAQAALKSSASDDPLVANFRLRFRPEGDARAEGSEYANFEYASTSPVDAYRVPSFDGWDALELEYRVPWPLGLLLTRDALRRYNALHRYLFRLRRVAAALDDAWFQLRRKAAGASTTTPGALRAGEQRAARERRRNGDDAAFEACQRARRDVSFLVNNWLTYLQVDVVEAQYREMIARVERAATEDFAEAQRAHRSFLAAIAAQSFLDLASVTDVVEAIMRLAANLCAVVASLPSDGSPPSEDAAAEAEAIGAAFARQSAALYSLLRSNRLADDPKAPYLRQLLLRLNYNDFFFAAARIEKARDGGGHRRGDERAKHADGFAARDGVFSNASDGVFSNASDGAAPSTVGERSVPASLAASGASTASTRRGGWDVSASDAGAPPSLTFRRA